MGRLMTDARSLHCKEEGVVKKSDVGEGKITSAMVLGTLGGPSALSPYDLLSAFRLRCTVHPQQGQPQPVGGVFQPGEPEHSQLITVQTI